MTVRTATREDLDRIAAELLRSDVWGCCNMVEEAIRLSEEGIIGRDSELFVTFGSIENPGEKEIFQWIIVSERLAETNTTKNKAAYWADRVRIRLDQMRYGEGCVKSRTMSFPYEHLFKGDTPSEVVASLVQRATKLLSLDGAESVEYDAGGEPGRVDVQVFERGDGFPPDGENLKDWKIHKCRLYMTTYTIHVRDADGEPVRCQ